MSGVIETTKQPEDSLTLAANKKVTVSTRCVLGRNVAHVIAQKGDIRHFPPSWIVELIHPSMLIIHRIWISSLGTFSPSREDQGLAILIVHQCSSSTAFR